MWRRSCWINSSNNLSGCCPTFPRWVTYDWRYPQNVSSKRGELEISYKCRFWWENHLQMADVPLPCWITGGFLWKCCESTEPVTGCWFFFPLLLGYVEEYHCKKQQPEIPEIEKTFYLLSTILLVKKYAKDIAIFFLYPEPQMAEVDSAPICWTTVSMSYVPSGLGKTPMFLA